MSHSSSIFRLFRLSWESINPFVAASIEGQRGRGVWSQLGDGEWAALPWQGPQVKVTADPFDQWNTLLNWAGSREQPIRNVVLERIDVHVPADGWHAISRGEP